MIKFTRVSKSDGKLLASGDLQEGDRAVPRDVERLLQNVGVMSVTLSLSTGEAVHYEQV